MKKLLSVLVLSVLCVSLFCGCDVDPSVSGSSNSDSSPVYNGDCMILVAKDQKDSFYYYRDSRTDVMYLRFRDKSGYAGMGGLTVMLHPDGSPLLYSEWLSLGGES